MVIKRYIPWDIQEGYVSSNEIIESTELDQMVFSLNDWYHDKLLYSSVIISNKTKPYLKNTLSPKIMFWKR